MGWALFGRIDAKYLGDSRYTCTAMAKANVVTAKYRPWMRREGRGEVTPLGEHGHEQDRQHQGAGHVRVAGEVVEALLDDADGHAGEEGDGEALHAGDNRSGQRVQEDEGPDVGAHGDADDRDAEEHGEGRQHGGD